MRRYIWIIFILVVGCAPWTQVGGLYKNESYNFSVELPQGWMRWNKGEQLFITRDGVSLQYIQIGRMKIEDPLKHTKKKFSKGMLPQEAAEVYLDNLATNSNILNLEVIENIPATIKGIPGFKAVYSYKNKDGLKLKSIHYGFIVGDWLYSINYHAAQRYYFEKDIKTFEKIVESFNFIKTV
jgi:major membrane immunogen (membrane-anchored lipoprotein)